MDVVYDHAEDVAQGIRTIWFRAASKPNYVAGQYIELYLPHEKPDSRGQKRWFTLSSSPSEELLAITTKQADTKASTFKTQLFGLRPGTRVSMSQPMGDFVLPIDPKIPLVFIAAGVGITPVRSMITWLLSKNDKRDIHIIYGASSLDEIAFRELFENYGAKLEIILTKITAGRPGQAAKIDNELVMKLVPSLKDKLIFISGPESFVEKTETSLRTAGVPAEQLVLDYYHGYEVT